MIKLGIWKDGETILNCPNCNPRCPYETSRGKFAGRKGAMIQETETHHQILAATGC